MEPLCTLQSLVDSLTHHGDRPAVVALHKEGSETWSYAQLAEHSGQFARRLLRQGLAPGDRIAIVARTRPEWLAACLGIIQAGGVVAPLDVQFADDVLASVLEACQPRWLVTTTDEVERLSQLDLDVSPPFILLDGDRTTSATGGSYQSKETRLFTPSNPTTRLCCSTPRALLDRPKAYR